MFHRLCSTNTGSRVDSPSLCAWEEDTAVSASLWAFGTDELSVCQMSNADCCPRKYLVLTYTSFVHGLSVLQHKIVAGKQHFYWKCCWKSHRHLTCITGSSCLEGGGDKQTRKHIPEHLLKTTTIELSRCSETLESIPELLCDYVCREAQGVI